MITHPKLFTLTRNHWYGLGVRATYAKGDGWLIVIRFICWQLWIEFGGVD